MPPSTASSRARSLISIGELSEYLGVPVKISDVSIPTAKRDLWATLLDEAVEFARRGLPT